MWPWLSFRIVGSLIALGIWLLQGSNLMAADRVIIGMLMATFLFAMLLAGTRIAVHWPYFVSLIVATGLFGWQQWLIRDRSRAHSFAAFRNNNWVGLALWLGLLIALAIR